LRDSVSNSIMLVWRTLSPVTVQDHSSAVLSTVLWHELRAMSLGAQPIISNNAAAENVRIGTL
jgi:hypothetical protein